MDESRKRSHPSPSDLCRAFRHDLAAAWALFRGKYPDHTPYAFVLYGVEGGNPRLSPHVLTEETLTEVAQRYLDGGYYDSLDEASRGLRFSVADSPLFRELESHIPNVDALVEPLALVDDETAGYKRLAKAAMIALAELDAERVFGHGAAREKLLLIINTEVTEQDWSTPSVKRLNSRSAFERYRKHTKIEGKYASCDALALAPHGHYVCFTGSKANPKGKPGSNEFLSEIVFCDLNGHRPSRRWAFTFPGFGDSGRAITSAPDGTSVIALRAKYRESECRSILMRFGAEDGKLLLQESVVGEPASFAQSRDGTRIAVLMHDRRLYLLDEAFRLLETRLLDATANGLCFLRGGDLLAATEVGVVRLSPMTDALPAMIPGPAHHLSTDESEKLLAVSRWFPQRGMGCDKVEFGVNLYRLPSFEFVRNFMAPGHEGVAGVLSSDGKVLAFAAHDITTVRKSVVAFDVASGRELGRRKCGFPRDMCFLRDNRTVLIPTSGYTKREPIDYWTIPHTG